MYYYLLSSKDVKRNAKQLATRVQGVCKDVTVYDLPNSQHVAVKDELPQDCKTLVVIRIDRQLTWQEIKAILDELSRHYKKPFSMGELDFAELIAYVNGLARATSAEREKTADAVAADQTAIEAALKKQHGPRGLAKNIWKALFKLYLYDPQSEAVQSLILAIAKSSLMHRHAQRLDSAHAEESAVAVRPRKGRGSERRVSFAAYKPVVLEGMRRHIEARAREVSELSTQLEGLNEKIAQLEANQLRSGAEAIDSQALQEYQEASSRLINEREALKAQIAELEKQEREQNASATHGELVGAQSRISELQAELEQLKQQTGPMPLISAADDAAAALPDRDQLFAEVAQLSEFMKGFLKSPEATDEKRAALQRDMARLRAGLTALIAAAPSAMDSTEPTTAQEEVAAKIEKIDELHQLLTVKPDAETQARIGKLEEELAQQREKAARLEADLAELRVASLAERPADDRPSQEAFDSAQRALRDAHVALYRLRSGQQEASAPLSRQLSVSEADFLAVVEKLEAWVRENCFYLQKSFLDFLRQLILFVRTFAENADSELVDKHKKAMNNLYPALLSRRAEFTSSQEAVLYQMLGDIVSLNVESAWARDRNISFLFQHIEKLIHQANASIQFYRDDDGNIEKINQIFRENIQRYLLMLNEAGEKTAQIVVTVFIFEKIQAQGNRHKVPFKGAENLAEFVSRVKEKEKDFVEKRSKHNAAYIEMTDEQRRMCGNPVVTKRELEQTINKKKAERDQLRERNSNDEAFCQLCREKLEDLEGYRDQEMREIKEKIAQCQANRKQVKEKIEQERDAWERRVATNRAELARLEAKQSLPEGLTRNEQAQYGILTSEGRLRVDDQFSASNLTAQESRCAREISELRKALDNYPDIPVLEARFKRQLEEREREIGLRCDKASALDHEISALEKKLQSFEADLQENMPKYEALKKADDEKRAAYQAFREIIETFKNEVEVDYNARYLEYLEKMKEGILVLICQRCPGIDPKRFKHLLDVELNLAWSISLYRRLSFQRGREGFRDFVTATQMMPLASRVQSANEERSRAGLTAGFAVVKKDEKKEEMTSASASSAATAIKQASEESIADLFSIETTFVESCITVLMEAENISFYQAFLIFAECIYSAFSADVENVEIKQYLYLLFYNLSMAADEVSLPKLTNLLPGFFTRLCAPLFELFFYELGTNVGNHSGYFTVVKPAPARAVAQTSQQSNLLAKFGGLNLLTKSIGQRAGSNNMLLYFAADLKELIGRLPRLQDGDDLEAYKHNIVAEVVKLFDDWVSDPKNLEKMLKDGASFVHRGEVIKKSKDNGGEADASREPQSKQDDSLLDDSRQLSLDQGLLDKIDANLNQHTFRAIMVNLKRVIHQQFLDAKLDLSDLYSKMAAVLALRLKLVDCDETTFDEQLQSLLKQKTEEAVLFDVAAIKRPDEADRQRKLTAFNEEEARRRADAELLLQRLQQDLAVLVENIENAESINGPSLACVEQSFSPLEQSVKAATTALSTQQQVRQSQQSLYEQLSVAGVPDEETARRLINNATALSQEIAHAKAEVQAKNKALVDSKRDYDENPQRASLLRLSELLQGYLREFDRIQRTFVSNVQSLVDSADFQARLAEVKANLLELQARFSLPGAETSEEASHLLEKLSGLLSDFQGLDSQVGDLLVYLNQRADEYSLSEAERMAREGAEKAERERVAKENEAAREVLGAEVVSALAPAGNPLADLPRELAEAKATIVRAQAAFDQAQHRFDDAKQAFSKALSAAGASLQALSNQPINSLDAANDAIHALSALQARGQSFSQLGECFKDLQKAQQSLADNRATLAREQHAFNRLVDSKRSGVQALKAQLEGFQTRAQRCGYSNPDLDGRLTSCNTWLTNDRLGFSQYPSVNVVSPTVETVDSQSQEKAQHDRRYSELMSQFEAQRTAYGVGLAERLTNDLSDGRLKLKALQEKLAAYKTQLDAFKAKRSALVDAIPAMSTVVTGADLSSLSNRVIINILSVDSFDLAGAQEQRITHQRDYESFDKVYSAYTNALRDHAGVEAIYHAVFRLHCELDRLQSELNKHRDGLSRDSVQLSNDQAGLQREIREFLKTLASIDLSHHEPESLGTLPKQLQETWDSCFDQAQQKIAGEIRQLDAHIEKKAAEEKSFQENKAEFLNLLQALEDDADLQDRLAGFENDVRCFAVDYPAVPEASVAEAHGAISSRLPAVAVVAEMNVPELQQLEAQIKQEKSRLEAEEAGLRAAEADRAQRASVFSQRKSALEAKQSEVRPLLAEARERLAKLNRLLPVLQAREPFSADSARLRALVASVDSFRQRFEAASAQFSGVSFGREETAATERLREDSESLVAVERAFDARKRALLAKTERTLGDLIRQAGAANDTFVSASLNLYRDLSVALENPEVPLEADVLSELPSDEPSELLRAREILRADRVLRVQIEALGERCRRRAKMLADFAAEQAEPSSYAEVKAFREVYQTALDKINAQQSAAEKEISALLNIMPDQPFNTKIEQIQERLRLLQQKKQDFLDQLSYLRDQANRSDQDIATKIEAAREANAEAVQDAEGRVKFYDSQREIIAVLRNAEIGKVLSTSFDNTFQLDQLAVDRLKRLRAMLGTFDFTTNRVTIAAPNKGLVSLLSKLRKLDHSEKSSGVRNILSDFQTHDSAFLLQVIKSADLPQLHPLSICQVLYHLQEDALNLLTQVHAYCQSDLNFDAQVAHWMDELVDERGWLKTDDASLALNESTTPGNCQKSCAMARVVLNDYMAFSAELMARNYLRICKQLSLNAGVLLGFAELEVRFMCLTVVLNKMPVIAELYDSLEKAFRSFLVVFVAYLVGTSGVEIDHLKAFLVNLENEMTTVCGLIESKLNEKRYNTYESNTYAQEYGLDVRDEFLRLLTEAQVHVSMLCSTMFSDLGHDACGLPTKMLEQDPWLCHMDMSQNSLGPKKLTAKKAVELPPLRADSRPGSGAPSRTPSRQSLPRLPARTSLTYSEMFQASAAAAASAEPAPRSRSASFDDGQPTTNTAAGAAFIRTAPAKPPAQAIPPGSSVRKLDLDSGPPARVAPRAPAAAVLRASASRATLHPPSDAATAKRSPRSAAAAAQALAASLGDAPEAVSSAYSGLMSPRGRGSASSRVNAERGRGASPARPDAGSPAPRGRGR